MVALEKEPMPNRATVRLEVSDRRLESCLTIFLEPAGHSYAMASGVAFDELSSGARSRASTNGTATLPPGFTLRALRPGDANTRDETCQYRSDTSLQMLNSLLHRQRAGNVGIEDENGELAGCASAGLASSNP